MGRLRRKVVASESDDAEEACNAPKPQAQESEPVACEESLFSALDAPTEGVWSIDLQGTGHWGEAHVSSSSSSGSYLQQKGTSQKIPLEIVGDGSPASPFRIGDAKLIESSPGSRRWQWPSGRISTWTQLQTPLSSTSSKRTASAGRANSPPPRARAPKRSRISPESPLADSESDAEQEQSASDAAVELEDIFSEDSDVPKAQSPPKRPKPAPQRHINPTRAPRRASAARAMARISKRLIDSDEEFAHPKAQAAEALAASDGESSDFTDVRQKRSKRSRPAEQMIDPPDVLGDTDATSWAEDLESRRSKPMNHRSSFSSAPCGQKMIRSLSQESFLGGRPIFDTQRQVNLQLLVAAYHDMMCSGGEHFSSEDRHILWLVEAARALKVVSLEQLRSGKMMKERNTRDQAAVVMFAPDRELRFPVQKRKISDGDDNTLFDDSAKKQMRERKVANLRTFSQNRQAHISAASSNNTKVSDVYDSVMAPRMTFDQIWDNKKADSDDEDNMELEVCADKDQGSVRDMFKESLHRSISVKQLQDLHAKRSQEDLEMLLEAEALERADAGDDVTVGPKEDSAETKEEDKTADGAEEVEDNMAAAIGRRKRVVLEDDDSSMSKVTEACQSDSAFETKSETQLAVQSPQKLPPEPSRDTMQVQQPGDEETPSSSAVSSGPCGDAQGTEVSAERTVTTAEAPDTKLQASPSKSKDSKDASVDTQQRDRKMRQALLLDMFKRSFAKAAAAMATTAEKSSSSTAVCEQPDANVVSKPADTETTAESTSTPTAAAEVQDLAADPGLSGKSASTLTKAKMTESIHIENEEDCFRACMSNGPGQSPSYGPWRETRREAEDDGDIMAAANDMSCPTGDSISEVLTNALETAFPTLRRLRRLDSKTEQAVEDSPDAEESSQEEFNDADEDEDDPNVGGYFGSEEVAMSDEFLRARRRMVRRKRRHMEKLDRKLKFELEDIAEIRDEAKRMVLLGMSTMTSEDQQRWHHIIDDTFASLPAPIVESSNHASSTGGSTGPGEDSVQPLSREKSKPLFSSCKDDDFGDHYRLAGPARKGVRYSFLNSAVKRAVVAKAS